MEEHTNHGHQASIEQGLDFVNTLEFSRTGPTEHLDTIDAALRWLYDHELMHGDALESARFRFANDEASGERALSRLRRVRGALRDLVDAAVEGRSPGATSLEVVNRALRTPYIYQLVPAGDGVSLDHQHVGDPIAGALARLSESIAREVSQGEPDRLRVCANDECRWAFYDISRSGRRKWCDMASCGNRAKAARHRARQRGDG
jgi:predicted RNA-binding Zn ribbon-like protein